jgi:hypothetical protein
MCTKESLPIIGSLVLELWIVIMERVTLAIFRMVNTMAMEN